MDLDAVDTRKYVIDRGRPPILRSREEWNRGLKEIARLKRAREEAKDEHNVRDPRKVL